MAEPLTPERIAELRTEDCECYSSYEPGEGYGGHFVENRTCPLHSDEITKQLLDTAEQATTLRDENERLREAFGHLNVQLGDQLERMNRLNAAQDSIIAKLDAALAEGGAS